MNPFKAILFAAALASASGCATVRQLRDPSSLPANGKAEKTRTNDALDYSVAIKIAAPPQAVWNVLTDAPGYTSWNSDLLRLDGKIEPGAKIKLVVKAAPDRTFELTVSTFEAPRKMVWEDGGSMFLGVRTYLLTPSPDGGTVFAMSETFSGGILGMIESSLPDFTQSFESFASDLKKRVESGK